jgi:hypothetical protein
LHPYGGVGPRQAIEFSVILACISSCHRFQGAQYSRRQSLLKRFSVSDTGVVLGVDVSQQHHISVIKQPITISFQ